MDLLEADFGPASMTRHAMCSVSSRTSNGAVVCRDKKSPA
jgi:hypothetical protein